MDGFVGGKEWEYVRVVELFGWLGEGGMVRDCAKTDVV